MRLVGLLCLCIAYIKLADGLGCSCDQPNYNFKLSGSQIAFPCSSTKNIYLQTGRYVPENIIATRTQIFKENAIVALPRLKHGSPFTLATFSLKSKECRATLIPFPCWSIQEEGNCEALQSVVDIFLDPTDILWALDVGIVNTLEHPIRRCPPKLVGVNGKTGQIVKLIDLTSLTTSASQLNNVLVDYDSDGNAFAIISDSGTGAIIVYSIYAESGLRIVLPKVVAAGCGSKDVLYIALARRQNDKVLFFTYLNSEKLFYINVNYLYKGQTSGAIVDVGGKPNGKIVLLGTDNGSSLFFRYKGQSDIYVWNSLSCFKPHNFILVQPSGDGRLSTQVVPGYKRLMWVLESNFQDYLNNTAGSLGPSITLHPLIKTCDV